MGAHLAIVAVGGDCADHVGRVDVFQSGRKTFLLAVFDDFCLEEDTDVLNGKGGTGNLIFPD